MKRQLPSSVYGPEVFLISIGFSNDAKEGASAILALQPKIQLELDKLCHVNPNIAFKRVEMWKWDTHAAAIVGGQAAVVTPQMKRANAVVFVFSERIGEVTWQELSLVRRRTPPVPVLPFFPAKPPSEAKMMDPEVAYNWSDLLQKRRTLSEDWTEPNSRSVTPLPQYVSVRDLKRLAFAYLVAELVRIASRYAVGPKTNSAPRIAVSVRRHGSSRGKRPLRAPR
jgi:hypothetical protein